MNEEELLRRDNFLMSHGNLPYDTTTCETYGLSGNCGQKCPNFKNKTCEVYVDVLERENQKYKEVIDKAINYIEWHSKFIFGKAERRFSDGKLECADGVEVFTGSPTKLLDILKEVK